jgi:hypothetical protein
MRKKTVLKAIIRFLAAFSANVAAAEFLSIPVSEDLPTLTVRIVLCIVYAIIAIRMEVVNQRI